MTRTSLNIKAGPEGDALLTAAGHSLRSTLLLSVLEADRPFEVSLAALLFISDSPLMSQA